MRTQLIRSHDGKLHLYSDGAPVYGAAVSHISQNHDGELQAVIVVPLNSVALGEINNVVPFAFPTTHPAADKVTR